MPELLAALAERTDEFRLSLVTGNLEPIARRKLARAGIGGYFEPGQGGFGSDHLDREELPPIARARAGDWPRERTVVIGDTPRDIACARADGVRVAAVATGPFAIEELADADAVVDDARALLPVLEDFAASDLPDDRGAAAAAPGRLGRGEEAPAVEELDARSPRRSRSARRRTTWPRRREARLCSNAGSGIVVSRPRCAATRAAPRSPAAATCRARAARRSTCSTVVMIIEPPGEPTASTGRPWCVMIVGAIELRGRLPPSARFGRRERAEVEVRQLVVEQEAPARHHDAVAAGRLDRERVRDDEAAVVGDREVGRRRALGRRRDVAARGAVPAATGLVAAVSVISARRSAAKRSESRQRSGTSK